MSLTLFGPPTFQGPVTIIGDNVATDNILVVKDNPAVPRSGAAQMVEVFDHNGNPITSVPPAGGPKVFGDNLSAGTGVFGPFTGVDGPNQAIAYDLTAVNHATQRVFSVNGAAPAAGLGNNGDFAWRQDTPGTANQRLYVKSAGAWTGIL